jgi:hypothetical protein
MKKKLEDLKKELPIKNPRKLLKPLKNTTEDTEFENYSFIINENIKLN